MTSLSAALLIGQAGHEAPKRATRVLRGFPAWLHPALNAAYPEEVAKRFGKPIRSDWAAGVLLCALNDASGCAPFDHVGHDADENLISEPYAATCATCQAAASEFARRLGVRFTVSEQTYHAPGVAVRFTFSKPGVRR